MYVFLFIYIPIWLDLLYNKRAKQIEFVFDLHSNMVRFIIKRVYTLLYRSL